MIDILELVSVIEVALLQIGIFTTQNLIKSIIITSLAILNFCNKVAMGILTTIKIKSDMKLYSWGSHTHSSRLAS